MKVLYTSMVVLFVAGCATVGAPKELRDARSANQESSGGVTARLNPADLHTAQVSLATAEQSFADNGDTQKTRDLSYAADIRFQTADSRARTLETNRERDRAVAQMQANLVASGKRTSADLDRAKDRLDTQGQAMQDEAQRHNAAEAGSARALQVEQQRRIDAEKRAAQAAADLARLGAVKQDPRGMILTLSGSVLFASAKSELLPSAQVKLNQVAEVLIKQDPDSKIVVEGFTDSQGTEAYNQDLSQRRAQAVRDYLVSRGIASDRVSAVGHGLNSPIGNNASAEGRANNRRVEIVVQPATKR